MSFHAEICGLFHRKQADVALAARSLQTSKAGINSMGCRIHPLFTPPGYMGAQAAEHTSDLFHGITSVSSGKGISEAAANILTLSKNFTASCKISRFPIFFLPNFFSHMDETLTERFPTPSNPTAKFLDCGGVIIPAPFPTPSLNSP